MDYVICSNPGDNKDTDEKNNNKLTQHHKILLHKHTNVSLQDASIKFLQLIRRSQMRYTEPDVKLWLASSLTTINNLEKKDFIINSPPTSFQLILYGIIADWPAMKMILNMVGHTGYYCCFFCYIKEVHSKEAHKRQYPYCLQIQQRTQGTF
ncbi:unnamed protein product [Rotaria magnacalcarata]|uniref:Uncharacterized protein n=1 Tax=Rotaria magnacalcarata TaxID=392030 RepID=A0A8S2SCJ3_9BILA|nr:unnamed protein product [Rotaria magnacalcarata]